MLTGHVALRGNAYALIKMGGGGAIAELIPLHPDRISIEVAQDGYYPFRYIYYRPDGVQEKYIAAEILHLRGLSNDGLVGLSPISHARESVGLALAAEEHAARLFSNGASIRGVLQTDGSLSPESYQRLKEQFSATYMGLSNAGKTAVLEDGVKWESIGMSNTDAQFLELRKFQRSDIAGIFRVPPHLIGDLEKATFSNIEQQALEFLSYCMLPYFEMWEQALERDLFWSTERGKFVVEVLVDNLLRADIKSRYEAYSVARNNGWLNVDEIRERENMNQIGEEAGGKIRLAPLNMVPLDKFGTEPPDDPDDPDDPDETDDPDEPKQKGPVSVPRMNRDALRETLLYALTGILHTEINGLRKLLKHEFNSSTIPQVCSAFQGYRSNMSRVLNPIFILATGKDMPGWIAHSWETRHCGYLQTILTTEVPIDAKREKINATLDTWIDREPLIIADECMRYIEREESNA
jgi:HK97 family phage portal protein